MSVTTDLSRTVLLPIDVQQGFDDPSWPPRWNDEMEANGRALLARWRAAGAPIIHVRHDSVQPGSSLAADHWGNAFRSGFEPQDGEPVVAKSVNSAFIGTDLDLRLRRLGAETVVAFGISTDMCVSTTIRTGANMGWRMVLVADACDCFDLPDGRGGTISARAIHDAHVATLAMEFCAVTSTAEATGRAAA
ncbi:cysteine hydrolase family protein [Sphingosinicella sp. CPCC 101087]|uniref:cysteine hydrolase family protein n=1 Tax=Sphingosinicella sp. CPCC 101087 TaxID=2497754 RepID=UPI00101C7EA1|nr:cysteine hydrolase family protein [Sphingosinicella sp. CPCC 101087]